MRRFVFGFVAGCMRADFYREQINGRFARNNGLLQEMPNRRLALLMFLQYAVPGSFVPLYTVWLASLGFEPMAMAWACATSALASLVAPLVAGQVADRWVPAEKCIAFCATAAGATLWALAELEHPVPVFFGSLVLWLFLVPVLTLGVALSFRQLAHPERDFGRIRLWGTVGWVASGLVVGYWFSNPDWVKHIRSLLQEQPGVSELADGLRLGGLLAFALAVYALTLPNTPPVTAPPSTTADAEGKIASWRRFLEAPLVALRLCRRRSFAVFCICSLGLYVTIPFSSQMSPLLLAQLGVPREWLAPALTIAQSTEVMTLAILPMLLLRLQVRGTLILGLSAWAVALALQATGLPMGVVLGALSLNGICICCFLVAGQLYVNRQARADIRASAQALLTFINGLGLLLGHVAVGAVRRLAEGDFMISFAVAALLAVGLVGLFVIGFKGDDPPD